MRADRLIAALLLMQSRGQVTAAELARELEVSLATARRDLEALSAAGIPVYPQAGRGGGWSLLGGARTDLSGLNAAESQALFLLLGPAAALSPETRSALRKLTRALPSSFRADAEAAAGAVTVDPSAWGQRESRRPEVLKLLESAVVGRRRVSFTYAGRGSSPRSRMVEPWGLVSKDDLWYLISGTEQGRRTFRVDRMSEVTATGQTFTRPEDFDLASAWAEIAAEMERKRSGLDATVLIGQRVVSVLVSQFGRQCEVLGPVEDGRVRVRVSAPSALMIAQTLAGWGSQIEVLEPPSVPAELIRIARELLDLYDLPE